MLLAGPNFGCGSSRETAVCSLVESGIRCVIAPSFGDIFHDNSYQNGLPPLRREMPALERIAGALGRSNASEMTVDLQRCVLEVPGLEAIPFNIPEDRRQRLLEGLHRLGFILRREGEIVEFEARDAVVRLRANFSGACS
jgi:3-isopropylmalate/(R)-2-methylmalate dehydratase small subunit